MALHLRLRCDIINEGCLLYAFVQAWLAQCALSSICALTNNYIIISFGLCHNCKEYEKRVLVSKLMDLMKTIAIAAVTAGGADLYAEPPRKAAIQLSFAVADKQYTIHILNPP